MGRYYNMELNYQDHNVFNNYIFSSLQNEKTTIQLLINSNRCNNLTINEDKNICLYLNNVNILLDYLIENNLYIANWNIKSNDDLFFDDDWFNLLDSLYKYFDHFHQKGLISFPNTYLFCNNELKKVQVEKYISVFKANNIVILLPYYANLESQNSNESIFKFIQKYKERVMLLINPSSTIDNYKYWKNMLNNYNITNKGFILNKCVNWTTKEIENCLKLLEYMIQDRFMEYDYNIEEFAKYVLNFSQSNNSYFDCLILDYYDKFRNNNISCHLNSKLTIDCKDLSFPACCGLCFSSFNGGHFVINENKITGIEAAEGMNGYFNQKLANSFYLPDCFACQNKYFCEKSCRSIQFEYHAEPFIPVPNICNLLNAKTNLFIKKYHELGLFHSFFNNSNNLLIENPYMKYQLIKILKEKGYPEYEYRYC